MTLERRAGVLMPVSSFKGTLGIGDLGPSAYEWIDALAKTESTIWQLLPLNPVGYGNSPYQTYSAFAGDEIFISVEDLYQSLGLEFDHEPVISKQVDYDKARKVKDAYLKEAYQSFVKTEAYEKFVNDAFWLDEYVEFMTLKHLNNNQSWLDWTVFDAPFDLMEYQRFLQFVFYTQWMNLKDYANSKSIRVVGDIPIYLGHDSAEVYFNREQFYLDHDGRPTLVAGVPPDFFSTEGQLWGNPIYRWDVMKKDNYKFWADRLIWNQLMYDVIRVDHFRAFDTYWVIPGDSTSAANGEWLIGPRNDLFDAMYAQVEGLELVVEDLGDLRPEVLELRDDYNLMGMKIVEFSLNKWDLEKDHTLDTNLLAYTGTHDNQTIPGWLNELDHEAFEDLKHNLTQMGFDEAEVWQKVNHYTMQLPCNWVILPMQDILGLDNEARINTPATIGSPNWEWKMSDYNDLESSMAEFARLVRLTNRVH